MKVDLQKKTYLGQLQQNYSCIYKKERTVRYFVVTQGLAIRYYAENHSVHRAELR